MKKRKRSNSDSESPLIEVGGNVKESLPITFEDVSKAALRIKSVRNYILVIATLCFYSILESYLYNNLLTFIAVN